MNERKIISFSNRRQFTRLGSVLPSDLQALLARAKAMNAEHREREPEYDGPRVKEPKSVVDPPTHVCPECRYAVNETDTYGYKRVDLGTRVREQPCPTCSPAVFRCQRSRLAAQYLRGITHRITPISKKELAYTLDSFPGDQNALSLIERFLCGQEENIYLWGKSGRGKTGLVLAALNHLQHAGVQVLFLKADRYLDLLRENIDNRMNRHGEGDNHIEAITRGVTVLALDDLGVGKFTEFAIAELEKLIDERQRLALRTIITSNFGFQQLEQVMRLEKFGDGFQPAERVISRLNVYQVYQVSGIDMRKTG